MLSSTGVAPWKVATMWMCMVCLAVMPSTSTFSSSRGATGDLVRAVIELFRSIVIGAVGPTTANSVKFDIACDTKRCCWLARVETVFLKALTLKGFKSFADPTTLVFEPGVTVIVGPNGSGKSNVVDAVAWVMGAQAPTSVRSAKMDEIIFAGTSARCPLGRAEVSLSMDNSDRLLPIEFEEVTITRTLFRSGDSTYALNGVPCRLLDIQELLSDTGVGRQQHVIVSQRQIDAVLNACPEDRRAVIEEAAGVLKYRRRKEKSERRLEATEANLTRLADVLSEVRRQLRPLERQATAAKRHGGLLAELDGLRRYLAGQEIQRLRSLVSRLSQEQAHNRSQLQGLLARLEALDRDSVTAEMELAALGGSDSGDELMGFEGLVERLRGLGAILEERRLRLLRERSAGIDADVVATLEAESNRLATELALAEREASELTSQAGDDAPADSKDMTKTSELLEQRRLDLVAQLDRCWSEAEELEAAQQASQAALEAQEFATCQARAGVDTASAAVGAAVGEYQAWQARHEALLLALDEAQDQAGAECLVGVEDMVGSMLEVVEVDRGWEAAFEAAVGEAIAAVVASNTGAAMRAIVILQQQGVSGVVLHLDADMVAPKASNTGMPLRPHVRSAVPGIDKLLDVLVGAVGVVETAEEAMAGVLADSSAVLVTRTGDRFCSLGWRVGAHRSGATKIMLHEAEEKVAEANEATAALQERLRHAKHQQQVEEASLEQAQEHLAACIQVVQAAKERSGHLERELRDVEVQITEQEGRLRLECKVRSAGLAERCRLLAAQRAEIEQRLSQMTQARQTVAARRVLIDTKLAVVQELANFVSDRSEIANLRLGKLRQQRDEQSRAACDAAGQLESLRQHRQQVEAELGGCRELDHRNELELAEVEVKLEAVTERCRSELGCEPQEAVAVPCPEISSDATPAERVRALEQELRIIGPVNPLALEEFEALSERHAFTQSQIDDVRQSRRELRKVIRKIDEAIVSVFSAAYADVSRNFSELFQTLFPDGEGRLCLTHPDALLETGVDVEARPSGKKIRRLSLLSGGERSLTALAFLFAVFRSCPSPFYVLDEVEAALDDANLQRFLNLVKTFRADAQLLMVSHQKRTMEAADCLYGVSMKSGGSSKVLSEKLVVSSDPEILLQPSLQQT
ncbi:MAG: AAA family ATPase [Acidimicrobiia bacterium]|nr:AAA family ATPase [Acidimicrobiia bacterium]